MLVGYFEYWTVKAISEKTTSEEWFLNTSVPYLVESLLVVPIPNVDKTIATSSSKCAIAADLQR